MRMKMDDTLKKLNKLIKSLKVSSPTKKEIRRTFKEDLRAQLDGLRGHYGNRYGDGFAFNVKIYAYPQNAPDWIVDEMMEDGRRGFDNLTDSSSDMYLPWVSGISLRGQSGGWVVVHDADTDGNLQEIEDIAATVRFIRGIPYFLDERDEEAYHENATKILTMLYQIPILEQIIEIERSILEKDIDEYEHVPYEE
jgi:hypothetical protein